MEWTPIKGISTKDERDNADLALFRAGYEGRLTKRKDGSRTVIDAECR